MKSFALFALFAVKFSGRNKAPFRGLGGGISEKSMNPIAFYSKTLFTFVASYHANASPQGEERTGGMTYYEEGVYL